MADRSARLQHIRAVGTCCGTGHMQLAAGSMAVVGLAGPSSPCLPPLARESTAPSRCTNGCVFAPPSEPSVVLTLAGCAYGAWLPEMPRLQRAHSLPAGARCSRAAAALSVGGRWWARRCVSVSRRYPCAPCQSFPCHCPASGGPFESAWRVCDFECNTRKALLLVAHPA